MRHRPLWIADLEQPDLAEIDVGEGVADKRIEALDVELDVEDAAAAGRHDHRLHVPQRRVRQTAVAPGAVEHPADDVEVDVVRRPGRDDPEARRLSRLRGERVGDVLVRITVERDPVGQPGAGLAKSSEAGSLIPSPFRYHSLPTRTYSLSTFGRSRFGWMMIAPYIPLAMCASTGLVPQWYM